MVYKFKKLKKAYLQPLILISFILMGLITSIRLDLAELLILILLTVTFLMQEQALLKKWFQLLLNLLPFFISLLILDILLDLGYFNTILLILKISYFILVSVFAVSLIPKEKLRRKNIHEFRGLSSKIKIFVISTLYYVHQISELLSRKSASLKDTIKIIIDSIKSRKELTLSTDQEQLADFSEVGNEKIMNYDPLTVFFLTIFFILIFWFEL